ncbi:hypothetical protein HYDPIDRAFT_158061 [Hydnomerulius pinastri MD-312]|uniref:Geranylgeranyl pyrophosphate synthetase n=1 Tax=Hydnomerulius pinastri MD-312 TaxID=994086 RepID=A0A0C9WCL9_9AGAM|nr:hypothetical protein HYDPIDRAFT_158061 [Hydnomerulius pinastri MD-312]
MPYRRYQKKPPVDPAFLLKDLQAPITRFSTDLSARTVGAVELKDLKAIASYSWIDAVTPTIAVPGSPRVWTNSRVTRVPADTGLQYIDQNAFRMRDHSPLLPIFVAIDSMHENFRYSDLDLVSDRSNVRKLLRFIGGAQGEQDFRIDIDLVGTTCLFTRREEKNCENFVNFCGYGYEYEKAATTATRGCEKAVGHHRIVSYDFGGLKVLLRFEVDACTLASTSDDDLLQSFSTLDTGTGGGAATTAPPLPASVLTVKYTTPRTLVPQSAMIEIKTRAVHRALDWTNIYPQLYLSQTAYLYVAKHDRGNFRAVERVDLDGVTMKPYAKQAEASMGKLKALLDVILEAVRKQGSGVPLSLVCQGGKLTLHKRKAGSSIGDGITNRFMGTISSRGI